MHFCTVGMNDLLAERKSQACSPFCTGTGFVGTVKGLRHVRKLLLGHSLAVILDRCRFPSASQNDLAALTASLDRVVGEVVKEH